MDVAKQPKKDAGIFWALAVSGALALVFCLWQFHNVFPAASIDLKLSKAEVQAKATEYLKSFGFSDPKFVVSTTFTESSYEKTFLEYELPMQEANTLMKDTIPIWMWSTRFCKQMQLEEYRIWLSPEGELCGWHHDFETERPLPDVSHEEALSLAINFAAKNAGIKLGEARAPTEKPQLLPHIKLIKDGTIKQPRRTDHYFTFSDDSREFKGGKLWTYVYVAGNEVSRLSRSLHVPDSFDRKYNQIRSYNQLYKSIASISFAIVSSATAFGFVWAMSTGRLRWRFALFMAAIGFVMQLLDTWNNFPMIVSIYETTKEFNAFLIDQVVNSLYQGAIAAVAVLVVCGGIEAVYRYFYPEKLALESLVSPKSFRSKQFLEGLFAGICVFGLQLGWVSAFYLFGKYVGVWSPIELSDVATLSSVVPSYSAFQVGVTASTTEEFLYRILCLSLMQLLCRNFWLANFIQAAGWAFMHSDYPQEPAYARGVELTVVGLFFGWLLRRFGVLPCIISHFMYDAFLGVTPLLFSARPLMIFSGVISFIVPVIACIVGFFTVKKNGFVSDEPLTNASISAMQKIGERTQAEVPGRYTYKGMTSRQRTFIVAAGAIALVAVLLPSQQIAGDTVLRCTQQQAIAVAQEYLVNRGIDVNGWQVGTTLADNLDSEEVQYAFEKEGFKRTNEVMKKVTYPLLWWVRFFKPQQRLEYRVAVNPVGRAIGVRVVEDEEAPGKTISAEEARKKVEEHLTEERPELKGFEFQSASEDKHANRTDHRARFIVPEHRLGDAHLRLSVGTVGDVVSFASAHWQIPDTWTFERQKQTLKDHVSQYARIGIGLVILIAGIIALIGLVRSQPLHWRPGIIVGIGFAVMSLLGAFNYLPQLIVGYDTDVPVASYTTQTIVSTLVRLLFTSTLLVLLATLSFAAFRLLCPGQSVLHGLLLPFKPAENEVDAAKDQWLDALVLTYGGVAFMIGFDAIFDSMRSYFSPTAPLPAFGAVTEAAARLSATWDIVHWAIVGSILLVLLVPVVVAMYARFLSNRVVFILAVIVFAAAGFSADRYWQDFAIDVTNFILSTYLSYVIISKFARNNILAYICMAFVGVVLGRTVELSQHAAPVFGPDIWICFVLAALPLVLGIIQIGRLRKTGKIASGNADADTQSTQPE